MVTPARPPVFWIELELEGPVRIIHSAQNEDEEDRLLDWIAASPRRAELARQAVDLIREAKVA